MVLGLTLQKVEGRALGPGEVIYPFPHNSFPPFVPTDPPNTYNIVLQIFLIKSFLYFIPQLSPTFSVGMPFENFN